MVYSAAQLMEMKPIRPWELLWEHCIEVYPEIEDEEEEEDFPDCKGLSDAQVVVALSCISRLPKPLSWGKELVPGVFGCRMSHCCSERDTCRQLLLDCAAAQQGLPMDTEFFPTEYAEEFLPKSCDFDEEDEEYPDWEPRQGSGYELERRFLLENCLYLYKHLMALRQELLDEAGVVDEG
jgi:hypothetical protein